jgi:hypothetical protein
VLGNPKNDNKTGKNILLTGTGGMHTGNGGGVHFGLHDFGQARAGSMSYIKGYFQGGDPGAVDGNGNLAGGIEFCVRNKTATGAAANYTQAMFIDQSSHVGIGTSTPDAKLHVNGNIKANCGIVAHGPYTSASPNDMDSGTFISWNDIPGLGESFYFNHAGTASGGHVWMRRDIWTGVATAPLKRSDQQMRLSSAGNLGIGSRWTCENPGMYAAGSPYAEWNGVDAVPYQLALSKDSAGKPASSTWTVSSDERLKEDIELADVDICYNSVKSIPLKYYKWRDEVYTEEEVEDRHRLGWIAQDVQSVFPKAVKERRMHGYEDCLSLDADQLYASMYGALQKVISLVETQAQTIAAMKEETSQLAQQNADLRARVMVLEQPLKP